MAEPQELKDQKQDEPKTPKGLTVKIGEEERTFQAEDVSSMLEAVGKADGFLKTCNKYGIDPEDYLSQAEGAFGVVRQLIDKGLIDEKGNIVEPKTKEPETRVPTTPRVDPSVEDKKLTPIMEALKSIGERISVMERDQDSLIRLNLEKDVREKYPELNSEDVSRALALSARDRKRGLWDHLSDLAKAKKVGEEELRKKHAKEFGINLDEFDRNKLQESGPEGGGSSLFAGKKIAFRKKKGEENVVTPKQAMQEYFKKLHRGG